ncbi:hypothetical protein RHSIM_Rhsim08G0235600 [Rhododendron simsii]|uniref:Uncharacterized protein n=1 Tax=Rhododendron simsii TaxID=118357 RepID=A0A834GN28_RHOSS|nr:hypothetical protein RHSIM_Rhsim08G0235600 [Rhododendron simsii]
MCNQVIKIQKLERSDTANGAGSTLKNWSNLITDHPDLQRKKRVASYQAYSAEGKMKGPFRKSFKKLKDTFSLVQLQTRDRLYKACGEPIACRFLPLDLRASGSRPGRLQGEHVFYLE